jgi:glycosyltransferase involved in cell wall biosynthesis
MSRPHVSVVIPTHDRPVFLAQTLAGALRQEGVDLEVVVVDDGSRPGLVAGVAGVDDPRVRVERNETARGVAAARNRGIETASGEWVAFLDDDDLWAPSKLLDEIRAAREAGTAWAYAGVVKIDERNRVIGGSPPPDPADVARRLPTWNLVPGGCSGVIVRREALAAAGGFDARLVNLADWDLWIRLGRVGTPAVAADPLVGYRYHRAQASLDVRLILAEADMLDGRYGSGVDRAALHRYLAHRSLLAGRRRDALAHFGRAAIRGDVRGAAVDVAGLAASGVRRRIGRPAAPTPAAARNAGWRAPASDWLRALDTAVAAPAAEERT